MPIVPTPHDRVPHARRGTPTPSSPMDRLRPRFPQPLFPMLRSEPPQVPTPDEDPTPAVLEPGPDGQ